MVMESETEVSLSPSQMREIEEKVRREFLVGVTQSTDCITPIDKKIELKQKPFCCPRAIKGEREVDKFAALQRAINMGYEDCYTNCNQQYVHTPFDLCNEIISTAKKYIGSFDGLSIMTLNMEFVEVLVKKHNVNENQIVFLTSCPAKANAIQQEFPNVEVVVENFNKFLNGSNVMAKKLFDCVVMNPPYQANTESGEKTGAAAIWHTFVLNATKITKEGGRIACIHPSGWRNIGGKFEEVQKEIFSKNLNYLEIHNVDDGLKTFGVGTRYDWYILTNSNNDGSQTTIVDENGVTQNVHLKSLPFIANGNMAEINSLFAKDGEEKVELLHSFSTYFQNKPHMNKERTNKFNLPCVQNVNVKNEISCFHYSSEDIGHFGVPKVIFGRKVSGVLVDKNGEYGMCQDCGGIVDKPKNLDKIQQAMLSKKFIDLMKMADVGGDRDRYNKRIIASLRKDFWKEFV